MAKKPQVKTMGDVPVRIPIPERFCDIVDPVLRHKAMKLHWEKYGYSDRFVLEGMIDGHFIMVRK